MAKLCRMLNIGFLDAFRGPTLYNKICIFEKSHFWRFLDFANLIRGRDRPEVAEPIKYYQNVFLGLFRSVFIPITLI